MKRNIKHFLTVLFLVWCLIPGGVEAAFLHNVPVTITQPDGTILHMFATGDEYHFRIHDSNGYTILRQQGTGWYVYADKSGNDLSETDYIVGLVDPAQLGLQPGYDISPEAWKQLRNDFWENTPQKPALPGYSPNLSPTSSGTLNNLIVYIRFSDQTDFPPQQSFYYNLFNNSAPTANSMLNYFKEASFNTLTINSTFYPIPSGDVILNYVDAHPRAYYMPYDATTNPTGYLDSERTTREHTLLKNAVDYISAQVPAGLNLDYNNDGYVDNVCFIIRGGVTDWATLLWPHRWSLYSQSALINGKEVYDYNFQLEDFLSGSGVGVLCHEMFHSLGAPDLYHYSYDGNTTVGSWDIMEWNTNPPQSMGAFMKYKYGGWISSIPTINSSGTYTLNPVTSSTNNAYKLVVPGSTTEYFVFEYRKKTGVFENSLPGSGLLIYRINTAAGNGNADGPPDEVYIYRPDGTPTDDGNIDLANFSSNVGRTIFSNTSNPYGFFSNGDLADVNVTDVTASDATISFTISMGSVADFTASRTSACPGQTIIFTDVSAGVPTSWQWSFSPSNVVYVDGTSSTSQNPHVQFTSAGTYSVTLSINGPNGPNSKTYTNYIQISSVYTTPFTEDFESGDFTTQGWSIQNPDNNLTWENSDAVAGSSGSHAAYINFYSYGSRPQYDYLSTSPINLSGLATAQLSFKVAYRQFNSSYKDSLKVLIYSNCGDTYLATPYVKTGTDLATGAATSSSFVPTTASDWRTETISLNSYLGSNIIVKFLGVNDYGNNLYIDDVSITGTGGVTANFTGTPVSACVGSNITFTDLSTGQPTSWSWSFGDGGTSTLQNPVHQYNTAGTYTVSLTVTKNSISNTYTRTNYISILPNLPVSVTISQSPSGSVCSGSSVTFTANPVNGGTSPVYQWKKNGANVGTNSGSYVINNLVNGDLIQCVVTSNLTCAISNPASSNTITAIVLQPVTPAVSITSNPSGPVCQGVSVTFTPAPVNGGSNPAYQWKKNGTTVGTGASYTSSTLANGDVITCTMTSNYACLTTSTATSNSVTMTVNPVTAASVTISANVSFPVCQGTAITFTAVPANGGTTPSYQWKKNGANVGTAPTYSTSALVNGDVISCVMTSNKVCVVNSPATSNLITTQINPQQPVSVTITCNPSLPVCLGTPLTFTATPVNGGNNPVYEWKKNGATVGNGTSAYSTSGYDNNDIIECVLTSNATCATGNPASSSPVTINAITSDPVSVSILANPSFPLCVGSNTIFSAQGTNGGSSPVYTWYKNGSIAGTGMNYAPVGLAENDEVNCVLTSSLSGCVTGNPATSNTITAQYDYPPVISLGPDTTIGLGSTLVLDPGVFTGYLWSDGSSNPTLPVTSTGVYSVTVTTPSGCISTDTIIVSVGFSTISGTVKYPNTALTPMTNTNVYLKQGTSTIYSTTTNSSGQFHFSNVAYGTYVLTAACSKVWGGVNSTDALIIMKHFVGISPLTGIRLQAADVDASHNVNSADALMVQRRVVMILNSFTAGDWVFESPQVIMDGSANINLDLSGLCYGDVNASYIPPLKQESKVELLTRGTAEAAPGTSFTIPVNGTANLSAGAITLILDYPAGDVEVTGVRMPYGTEENLVYEANGRLFISWYSLTPLETRAGDPVFLIDFRFRRNDPQAIGRFRLEAAGGSEFADADGIPMEKLWLTLPELVTANENASLQTSNFPNPFTGKTTIWFTLPETSFTTLKIYSSDGRLVENLVEKELSAGSHQFDWNAADLPAGVYYYKLLSGNRTRTQKVILLETP